MKPSAHCTRATGGRAGFGLGHCSCIAGPSFVLTGPAATPPRAKPSTRRTLLYANVRRSLDCGKDRLLLWRDGTAETGLRRGRGEGLERLPHDVRHSFEDVLR